MTPKKATYFVHSSKKIVFHILVVSSSEDSTGLPQPPVCKEKLGFYHLLPPLLNGCANHTDCFTHIRIFTGPLAK